MLKSFRIGDKVTYVPKEGNVEYGIVKSISEDFEKVFVVYECNNDWDYYMVYTAKSTEKKYLYHGWIDIKTSEEWLNTIPKYFNLRIVDPDGWNRNNFQYSFHEEKIPFQEFYDRIGKSTISINSFFNYLNNRLKDENKL